MIRNRLTEGKLPQDQRQKERCVKLMISKLTQPKPKPWTMSRHPVRKHKTKRTNTVKNTMEKKEKTRWVKSKTKWKGCVRQLSTTSVRKENRRKNHRLCWKQARVTGEKLEAKNTQGTRM